MSRIRACLYFFIWRCMNSFYTHIHEVAGDRALLPVEEHVGADAVDSQCLSIDVQLVAELGGHGQALWNVDIPAAVASSIPTVTLEWWWG